MEGLRRAEKKPCESVNDTAELDRPTLAEHDARGRIKVSVKMEYCPVAFVIDDKYAMPAAVVITSILTNKKEDVDYKFYICSNDLSRENKDALLSFEDFCPGTTVEIVDLDIKVFESIYVQSDSEVGAGSITALGKFLFPQVIPEDKVLYLDADILVRKDISELFSLPLDDYVAAVVKDSGLMYFRTHILESIPGYFNSGVMLINLKKSRDLDMTSRLVEAKKNTKETRLVDQDAFNVAYNGLILHLPPVYNALLVNLNNAVQKYSVAQFNEWTDSHFSCLYDLNDEAKIVHFSSHVKPWHCEDLGFDGMRFSEEWLGYYKASPFGRIELVREKLHPEKDSAKDIHVVIATGEGGLFSACVTGVSVLENSDPHRRCILSILVSNGAGEEENDRVQKLFSRYENCQVELVNVAEARDSRSLDISFARSSSFWKLVLPDLFPLLARVVYLESGVIATGDVAGLYDVELGGACLGGVEKAGLRYLDGYRGGYDRLFDLSADDWPVDTSVLLMDLAAMRDGGIDRKCLEATILGAHPSSILNGVCCGSVKRLELKYSYPPCGAVTAALPEGVSNEAGSRPVVIRFGDEGKPWEDFDCPLADRWWKYARMIPSWDSFLGVGADVVSARVRQGKLANFPSGGAGSVAPVFAGMRVEDYMTAVVRLKNSGTDTNDIVMLGTSDIAVQIIAPEWFAGAGKGYQICSRAGRLGLRFRCVGDGELNISLRSKDVVDELRKHIPIWVEYTSLHIDGESLIDKPMIAGRKNPHTFTRAVKDGQDVDLFLSWRIANAGGHAQDDNKGAISDLERLSRMLTARVDIKNVGTEGNSQDVLDVSDPSASVESPAWFRDAAGTGRVVKSCAGNLSLRLRCGGNGELQIRLRGQDVRGADGKRIPVWIDYTSLFVDGEPLLSEPVAVWHDKPFVVKRPVKDGQIVSVALSWHSHDERGLEWLVLSKKGTGNRSFAGENSRALARLDEQKTVAERRSCEIGRSRPSTSWKASRFGMWLSRKLKRWARRRRSEK